MTSGCSGDEARRILAILIPRIALLDCPEHRFLEFLEDGVVGVANRLQFLVEIVERLDQPLVRDLAQRPGHFR